MIRKYFKAFKILLQKESDGVNKIIQDRIDWAHLYQYNKKSLSNFPEFERLNKVKLAELIWEYYPSLKQHSNDWKEPKKYADSRALFIAIKELVESELSKSDLS